MGDLDEGLDVFLAPLGCIGAVVSLDFRPRLVFFVTALTDREIYLAVLSAPLLVVRSTLLLDLWLVFVGVVPVVGILDRLLAVRRVVPFPPFLRFFRIFERNSL